MSQIKVSAIVTGFPPELRPPKPLPGETLLQLVIRNHPQEWRNCMEQLKDDFHFSEDGCSRLSRGETSAAVEPSVKREIERFMNYRLPSHGRTLQGLAEIRKEMRELGGMNQPWQLELELSEIIWPRPKINGDDSEAEEFASSLGVTVLTIDVEDPDKQSPLDVGALLQYVHGDYLWILPGGSRLSGAMTIMALIRVFRSFQEEPKLAVYSDQCYSKIYRTAALRTLMAAGKKLSAELHDNARMLQEAGFELAADNDPVHGLVEIESLYGGQHDRFSQMRSARDRMSPTGRASWWQRLLGLK